MIFNSNKFVSVLEKSPELLEAMKRTAEKCYALRIIEMHIRERFKDFTPREDALDGTLFYATNLEMADFYYDTEYPLSYIEALTALESGQTVETNLDSVLDGYDKYNSFYLGITEYGSICWFCKKTNILRLPLFVNTETRNARFRLCKQ